MKEYRLEYARITFSTTLVDSFLVKKNVATRHSTHFWSYDKDDYLK